MDIYAIVTDKIINLLEQGVVPWRRPWTSAGLPRNLVSKKPYRGINHFLLSASKYVSPFWLTMRQANELGGHVRKGEEVRSSFSGKLTMRSRARKTSTTRRPTRRRADGSCLDIIACSTSNNANCRSGPRQDSDSRDARARPHRSCRNGSSPQCPTRQRFSTQAQRRSTARLPIALRCRRANCSLAPRNLCDGAA